MKLSKLPNKTWCLEDRNIIIMFDSIDEEYIFTTLKYKNSPVAHVKPTVKMLAMLEQFKADL